MCMDMSGWVYIEVKLSGPINLYEIKGKEAFFFPVSNDGWIWFYILIFFGVCFVAY